MNARRPSVPARAGKRASAADAVDIAMLLLAVFSVGLLLYVMFSDTASEGAAWLIIVDTSICGIFLAEFLWRWRSRGWERWFPLKQWYEILGMIPLAHPALRSFRLLRIVVIVVRLVRAADLAFGERFTFRLVDRMTEPIVNAIKRPITLAVLDEVANVLERGKYPQNLARSLRENSEQLRDLVTEKVQEDPTAGRIKLVPFHDQIVQSVVDTSMRVVLEVLADPRLDEFFSDVIRDNTAQIREAVARGEGEQPDGAPARVVS